MGGSQLGGISMTFGRFLQSERQTRGWAQQELAERLGISRQTVLALEKDQHWPSLELAIGIATLFDLSLDVLARALKEESSVTPTRPFPDSDQLKGPQPVVWSNVGPARVVIPISLLNFEHSFPDALWDKDTNQITPLPGARPPDRVLLIGGCDPFLPWLADLFHKKHPDWYLQPLRLSSEQALTFFKEHFLHVAGTHIYDAVARQYNSDEIVTQPHIKIPYLRWEEGLMRQPEQTIEHLAVREPGSEAHALYLRETKRTSYQPEIFYNHHSVLDMVRRRPNWAGIGLGALAVPYGLIFDSWATEHYDLWLHQEDLSSQWANRLLETITSRTLKSRFATIPHMEILTSQ